MWQSLLEHNSTVYSLNTRSQHYFLKTRLCTQRFAFYIFDSFFHVKSPLVGSTMLTGTPCINTYICIHRCTKYLLLFSHLRISSRYERRGGPSKCHAETFLLIHAKWTVLRSFAFLSQFFFFFFFTCTEPVSTMQSRNQLFILFRTYSKVFVVQTNRETKLGLDNEIFWYEISFIRVQIKINYVKKNMYISIVYKKLVNKQQFHKVLFEIDWYTNTFYTQCM